MKVAIAGDHAGFQLKEAVARELAEAGFAVTDLGTNSEEACDYPDFALKVAEEVAQGKADRGILVCGTGAGMAMVANKVPGVRAAACTEPFTAEHCRLHNDANVLTLGARVISPGAAMDIVRIFLATPYEGEKPDGERHRRRLEKVEGVERKYMKA